MSDDIPPQWAFDRARDLSSHNATPCLALSAFACYIAAHEEAPVDPLAEALVSVGWAREGFGPQVAENFRHTLGKRGLEIREIVK